MPGGTKSTKRSNRKKREALGYDADPPRCANCTHFQHAFLVTAGFQKVHQPARCGLIGFPTKIHAICDVWQGVDGSTLEN